MFIVPMTGGFRIVKDPEVGWSIWDEYELTYAARYFTTYDAAARWLARHIEVTIKPK